MRKDTKISTTTSLLCGCRCCCRSCAGSLKHVTMRNLSTLNYECLQVCHCKTFKMIYDLLAIYLVVCQQAGFVYNSADLETNNKKLFFFSSVFAQEAGFPSRTTLLHNDCVTSFKWS